MQLSPILRPLSSIALFFFIGRNSSLILSSSGGDGEALNLRSNHDSISSLPAPIFLRKRGYDLSLVHFDHSNIIAPVAGAAAALIHFYVRSFVIVLVPSILHTEWQDTANRHLLLAYQSGFSHHSSHISEQYR